MVNLDLGKLEIGLYKFLNDSYNELEIPLKVQVYLCGMMERAFNQEYAADLNQFIVPSMKKLEIRIAELEHDATDSLKKGISLIRIYKVGKYSGEFHTMNPILGGQLPGEMIFPETCFRYARQFAARIEKEEESEIFKAFVNSFPEYAQILRNYTKIINSGQLKLTKQDYEEFKDFLIASYDKSNTEIAETPSIQEEDIDDIIL